MGQIVSAEIKIVIDLYSIVRTDSDYLFWYLQILLSSEKVHLPVIINTECYVYYQPLLFKLSFLVSNCHRLDHIKFRLG